MTSQHGVISLLLLSLLGVAVHSDDMNIQVEYYTSVTLPCDDYTLNYTTSSIALQSTIKYKFWILPSGEIVNRTTVMINIELSPLFENFSLMIPKVDDPDFGYYTCVIVTDDYISTKIVRRGLNIDGPSFGDLDSKYRHNAMVGGIAAVIMFVLIGSTCLICNFRFVKKMNNRDHELKESLPNYRTAKYDNVVYDIKTEQPMDLSAESKITDTNGVRTAMSNLNKDEISHHF